MSTIPAAAAHRPGNARPRRFLRALHPAAGLTALATIITFWCSTAISELFLGRPAVVAVKCAVVAGMFLLIPALVAAAASGFRLGGRSRHPRLVAKRRRMPFIALNGLLILLPSALFLRSQALAGNFDTAFVIVQAVELAAGALNITLLALSAADGMSCARARRLHSAAV